MDNKKAIEIVKELIYGDSTVKVNEALNIAIEALEKQVPMQAFYEYDNEFICPACGHEDDGYEVTTIKVCPECGQKLKWS